MTNRAFTELLRRAVKELGLISSADNQFYTYTVPVRALTAGEYLLTIEVTAGSETVRRDVRFSIH
jgi:hypothetical protein